MKKATTIFTLLIAFVFSKTTQAQPQDHIILHGASKHGVLPGQVWQEHNYGIAYRLQQDQSIGYQVGTYRNSYNKQTVYGTVQYTPIGNNSLRFGVFSGIATGYKSPLVGGFMLNYHKDKAVFTVRHVPIIGANDASVTTFEIGFKF